MKVLDLFSGIGGFSLAGSWLGWETVAFVEIDPFCQKVLRKHWPHVPIFSDIKEFHAEHAANDASNDGLFVDIITGGFPCQPASHAGQRKGTADDRWLWPEMFRVICEVQPKWVVAENVPGLLSLERGMVFEGVCADLESAGYEVQPLIIPACGKGAPHRRDRIWLVAKSNALGCGRRKNDQGQQKTDGNGIEGTTAHNANGIGRRPQDAIPAGKQFNWSRGTRRGREGLADHDSHAPDASGSRRTVGLSGQDNRKEGNSGILDYGSPQRNGWEESWYEAATRLCRMDDGVSRRVDRLRALGNAIVPQVAYEIACAILRVEQK